MPPTLTFVVVGDGPYLDELKRIMGVVGPTWLIEGGGKGAPETGGEAGEGDGARRDRRAPRGQELS